MRLPKGYFAVLPEGADAAEPIFEYQGWEYEVTAGENVFPNLFDAAEAAWALGEVPETVLPGLPYAAFDAPVLLFSAGKYKIDGFDFRRSLILLGEGAGKDPNTTPDDPTEPPALSPERADPDRESRLYGSYWFGKMLITGAEAQTVVLDGFSSKMVRLIDSRTDGGRVLVALRNMQYVSPCGKTLHLFSRPRADGTLDRTVEMRNIRVTDFDDLDYGAIFVELNASHAVFDHLCYDTSRQIFGLCDISREFSNLPGNTQRTVVEFRHSYFRNLGGEHGISCGCGALTGDDDRAVTLTFDKCSFINASRAGESPLQPHLTKKSSLSVTDCVFADDRAEQPAAVTVTGEGSDVRFSGCTLRGFSCEWQTAPAVPKTAPASIDRSPRRTGTEDPHRVLPAEDGDFAAMESAYAGKRAYYGDLHVHTDCGGTSDGKFPMKDWVAAMDAAELDFAAVVDHRQMRGFFLPEWSEERFIIGTEPGTSVTDLNAVRHGQASIHYNMLFPHKYGLAMVLANFPEFEFRGDELTGSFRYPKFTKERFAELTAYVRSIDGIMVHPHPKTMLCSDDPTDFYFGEGMFLETIYGSPSSHASFKNYDLWVDLLARGLHVWAAGGSDTHGKVSNKAVATFYSAGRSGRAFFDIMRSADFTVGGVGMKMMIDGCPMGSELSYREGMKLTLRTDDFYRPAYRENTAYELRVITDRGIAFASLFDGTQPQELVLEVQDRKFYRAEVYDCTHGYRVAIGNPIWLDGVRTGAGQ